MQKIIQANKNTKTLGNDRRDDMRFNLRAKLANKDYANAKEMSKFHYTKQSGLNTTA